MSKILLCSHNYWVYDPVLLFNYLDGKKIFEKNSKVVVITSMNEMENIKLELADIYFEFIITSREYKVIDKIIDKLNNDYNLIIFYPPNRIKSGILRILQSERKKKT